MNRLDLGEGDIGEGDVRALVEHGGGETSRAEADAGRVEARLAYETLTPASALIRVSRPADSDHR